jgi:hypothetical protein
VDTDRAGPRTEDMSPHCTASSATPRLCDVAVAEVARVRHGASVVGQPPGVSREEHLCGRIGRSGRPPSPGSSRAVLGTSQGSDFVAWAFTERRVVLPPMVAFLLLARTAFWAIERAEIRWSIEHRHG